MHIQDGELRAYVDGALAEDARATVSEHLAQCDSCRRRTDEFSVRRDWLGAQLARLPGAAPASPEAALARFKARYGSRKESSVFQRVLSKRFRPVWAFAAVVALLLISMSFAPVRAWAGEFLGLFRVKNIEVVTVDPTLLGQLNGHSALAEQISQLLSTSVEVTHQPAKPQSVKSAAEASRVAGFTVRLPSNRTDTPQLVVNDGPAFEFTVDRQRAQSILDQAGRSDLQLPASLDGATIKVNVPKGVTAAYGDCPPMAQLDEGSGSAGRRFANCIVLAQVPSPTIDTPPDLNVEQLAELGLQFSGMSAQQARSFAQTVDWTSTLVVPIPRNAASYKEVQVDGVSGYLIERPIDDAPEYALIWVKNGIIYAVGGVGPNSSPALQMAQSMK